MAFWIKCIYFNDLHLRKGDKEVCENLLQGGMRWGQWRLGWESVIQNQTSWKFLFPKGWHLFIDDLVVQICMRLNFSNPKMGFLQVNRAWNTPYHCYQSLLLHKKRKIMIPRYCFGTKDLPTTLTGLLWGRNPNVYWKIPRPKKSTGANATFFWIFCWISRSQEPRGFFTWLKRSFSPKANTGTREALKNTERKVLLEDDKTSEWVSTKV